MYTNTTANHGVLTIHATRDVIVLIKLSAQIISAYCNPVLIKLRQQRTEVKLLIQLFSTRRVECLLYHYAHFET